MLVALLEEIKWDWKTADSVFQWEKYRGQKKSKDPLIIPLFIELSILVRLAELCLADGDIEGFQRLTHDGLLEAAGWPAAQALLRNSLETQKPVAAEEMVKAGA